MLGSPFHLFPLICLMEGARLLTKRHQTNLRSLIVLTAHFINTQVVNKLTNNANKSEQTQNTKWPKSAKTNDFSENCAWDPFEIIIKEKPEELWWTLEPSAPFCQQYIMGDVTHTDWKVCCLHYLGLEMSWQGEQDQLLPQCRPRAQQESEEGQEGGKNKWKKKQGSKKKEA